MTMPHRRMRAFLRAGELLWNVVQTEEHIKKWGAKLPERLVDEAQQALRDYPSSLEIQRAEDDQRSMHTWMACEVGSAERQRSFFDRLREATAQVGVETVPDHFAWISEAHLFEWLSTEHPALGYREPFDVLDVTSNPEMLVELFKAEESASREARRAFPSESMANRWLRRVNHSLGGIPLEMLGSDTGRRKVMEELCRLAAANSWMWMK